MISKKSRKVVAALLIGATICASGTFAYFNSKLDMKNIEGTDENTVSKLDITNGHVEITGKINGTTGTALGSLWSYDVARVSTRDAVNAAGENKDKVRSALELAGNGSTTLEAIAADTNYLATHRSPDIAQNDDEGTKKLANEAVKIQENGKDYTINRAIIGTQVTGKVLYARPGDAFVFGNGAGTEAGVADAGLDVINKSNITTKLGIRINGTKLAAIKDQVAAMNKAGWKVYIKIKGLDGAGNQTAISDYADYKEIDFDKLTGGNVIELIPLQAGTNASPVTEATNGTETGVKIQMRVELPLLSGNNYQDLNTTSATDGTGALDILDMFEIVATQENNPGWTQAGTNVSADKAFTDVDGTDADTDMADPTVAQ